MEYRDYYITPEDYEIAERNGICESTLRSRILQQGWSKERAITTKVRQKVDYGKWLQVSKENGINKNAFMQRVTGLGWSMERAATTPVKAREEIIGMMAEKHRKYPKEIIELAESNGISYYAFKSRVTNLKWDIVKAATTPIMSRRECGLLSKEKLKKYIDGLHKLNEADYMERCNKKSLSV